MAYTLWRYTIFLFIWFRTTESKEAIYCKGTNWKAGYVDSTVAANRSIIMRNTFTGCTHVIGNVEITYQQDTSIDFSFMNDIEDVSGYVLVTQSYIPYIPLPKLTVIRGEELFKESTALYVSYNYNQTSSDAAIAERTVGLLELRLVSLKEITTGGVLIFENSELCHAPSIDWTDIVVDTSTDIEVTYPLIQCDDCDSNCTEGCWGSGPEMCQILTKNVCNSSCENRCFGPGADQCCDANCIGGCTGSGPDQCLLCRNALNGDSCVETCPGKLVLDEGKCKEQCRPEWANINGVCEKSISCLGVDFTTKNTVVSGDNIATYKNCRVVKHNVIIDRESFHGDPFFGTIPLMSYGELFALENVEIIKGYLKVFGVDQSGVINLKFLRNLKEVHGDELEGEESIIISGSKSLKTLSLSSLKSVKRGDVQITNNVNLCLAKEDKWTAILLDYQTQKISISSNELRVNCEAQGYKCDKECYRYGGCWDVGADNCYECESFKLEGEEGSRCVNSCNTSRGEYHSSNKTCGLCDKQCDGTCTGPSSSECLSCRNFKDGDKCKEECPEYKYPDADKVCRPCHKDCVLGCTGESHIKGEGGCDDCYVTKIDHDQNKREIRECLPRTASCSEHFYEIKAIAEARICRECNSICLNCSGPSSDDCVSCITTSVDGKCVEKCDSNQGAFNGKCIQCHEQCSSGCTGPTAKDCKACAKAQVDFNGGIFECVRSCPKDLAIGVCVDG
ncbi:epidermal growth factor receptor-like [Antedon mediterranea]|uniref:epidermal growth factor receptor-like n=1 Tax=Antedon mediterranea TaxID=105859 RepID=UPI003AF90BD6